MNQCRKPQRVSTKWQSVHLPDPDTQRAISPCLHAQDPQSAHTNQLDLTNFLPCFVHGRSACHQTDFLVNRCTLTSRFLNSSHPSSEAKNFTCKAQSTPTPVASRAGGGALQHCHKRTEQSRGCTGAPVRQLPGPRSGGRPEQRQSLLQTLSWQSALPGQPPRPPAPPRAAAALCLPSPRPDQTCHQHHIHSIPLQ